MALSTDTDTAPQTQTTRGKTLLFCHTSPYQNFGPRGPKNLENGPLFFDDRAADGKKHSAKMRRLEISKKHTHFCDVSFSSGKKHSLHRTDNTYTVHTVSTKTTHSWPWLGKGSDVTEAKLQTSRVITKQLHAQVRESPQALHNSFSTSFTKACYDTLDWAISIFLLVRQQLESIDQIFTQTLRCRTRLENLCLTCTDTCLYQQ